MRSSERTKRPRPRRMALLILALAGLVIGWLLNDCVGLGPGGDRAGSGAGGPPDALAPAADAGMDAPPAPCALLLDSAGLALDGTPVTIDQAVRACRAAGKARLEATGAARAGTYDELLRALDRAGVDVHVQMKKPAAPASAGDAGSAAQ